MKNPFLKYQRHETEETIRHAVESVRKAVDSVRDQHGYYQAALTAYNQIMSKEAALESARPWRPDVATAGREELKLLLEGVNL